MHAIRRPWIIVTVLVAALTAHAQEDGRRGEDAGRPERGRQERRGPNEDRPENGRPEEGRRDEGRRGDEGRGEGRRGDFARRIMEHDADGDGKVTREELPERMRRVFDFADRNEDGAIDREEAEALRERSRRFRRGRGREEDRQNKPDRPDRPMSDDPHHTVADIPYSSGPAKQWMRFRGPNGTGVCPDDQPTPTRFSEKENLRWKTRLPGAGVSSPIIVGDRVFVTAYSGYGLDREAPGEMADLKRHLVCLDRKTGKIEWDRSVAAYLPEDPYEGMGVPEHGYASHSPVSDGERVYVFFGKSGALAFDLEGNQLWQTSVGTESDRARWGSSSSPILYRDLLIVTASAESEALVALNTADGKEVWRQETSGLDGVWGTPALAKKSSTRTDLVIGVPNEIWGLNPSTGRMRWHCRAMEGEQYNSSVVVDDAVVYGIEGRRGGAIAVSAGGFGDVSDSKVVWKGDHRSRFSTPLLHDGRLYFISNGVAACVDARTGKELFRERLKGGSELGPDDQGPQPSEAGDNADDDDQGEGNRDRRDGNRRRGGRPGRGGIDYSSPILVGDKIYYARQNGDVYVLKAGETFEQLAVNHLGSEGEAFSAVPAAGDGDLYFRSDRYMYCVGTKP